MANYIHNNAIKTIQQTSAEKTKTIKQIINRKNKMSKETRCWLPCRLHCIATNETAVKSNPIPKQRNEINPLFKQSRSTAKRSAAVHMYEAKEP